MHRGVAVHDLVDEHLGLVDAAGDGAAVKRLAVKAVELDVLVGSDDDALAAGDILGGEHVLGARGALGLDLDAQPHLLGLGLEGLGGHVGVGDAGRARGDGHQVVALGVLGGRGGSLGVVGGDLGVLGGVDHGDEVGSGLGGAQVRAERGIHEQHGKTAQHLEVRVRTGLGGGDEEHEIGRLAVGSVVVDAVGKRHRGKAGRRDRGGLGVRDRDALAKGRGALGLTGMDGLVVAVLVGDVATGGHEVDELGDDVVLVPCGTPDLDGFRLEQT